MNAFINLPSDILLSISSYCGYAEVMSFRLSCKHFKKLLDDDKVLRFVPCMMTFKNFDFFKEKLSSLSLHNMYYINPKLISRAQLGSVEENESNTLVLKIAKFIVNHYELGKEMKDQPKSFLENFDKKDLFLESEKFRDLFLWGDLPLGKGLDSFSETEESKRLSQALGTEFDRDSQTKGSGELGTYLSFQRPLTGCINDFHRLKVSSPGSIRTIFKVLTQMKSVKHIFSLSADCLKFPEDILWGILEGLKSSPGPLGQLLDIEVNNEQLDYLCEVLKGKQIEGIFLYLLSDVKVETFEKFLGVLSETQVRSIDFNVIKTHDPLLWEAYEQFKGKKKLV